MPRQFPILALALLCACRSAGDRELPPGGGRIEARWVGSDTGAMAGAGTAEWCGASGVLELRLLVGDSGMAVAVRPRDSAGVGRYPVMPPTARGPADSSAAVAVRWFGETVIHGFRGDSGTVTLERSSGGALSGRVGAWLQSVTDTNRIRLDATVADIPVRAASPECAGGGPPTPSAPTPSGVS